MKVTINTAIDIDGFDPSLSEKELEKVKLTVDVHTLVDGKVRENFKVETVITPNWMVMWSDIGKQIMEHINASDKYPEIGS